MQNVEYKDNLEESKKDFAHYRKCVMYMEANAPIGVLCLPKVIETILLREGYDRIYTLIGTDLAKIKGLGETRRELLTSRLDEFLSVSL